MNKASVHARARRGRWTCLRRTPARQGVDLPSSDSGTAGRGPLRQAHSAARAWGTEGIVLIFMVLIEFLIFWESCLNGNVVGHRIINSESGINCMDHDCVLANTERRQQEPITIRYVRAVRSRRKPQKVSFWQGDVKTVGRQRPIVTEVTHCLSVNGYF